MSVTLSGREKRRAIIGAAGSILDVVPSLPRRRNMRVPSTKHALARDAQAAVKDFSMGARDALHRQR